MVEVYVYGAEQVCASCVTFPSSKETVSWLEHALNRKYGLQVVVHYVDIYAPVGETQAAFSQRVLTEDLWYPVVVIQDEVIAEGNPKLKVIYETLEKLGLGQVKDNETIN
jgi:disulfide oxidoreductase YuzD